MFSSTTEDDSDDSIYKTGQKSRLLRISSSSSESDGSVVATNSRRKNYRVSSSSSESDDSSFGSPVRKKCKVLQMSESETSATADSDIDVNPFHTSSQRPRRRAISSDLDEPCNKDVAVRENNPQAEACSSDSDDGERCIICFKTLRPPFAHPSNCTHKFHPICLSTWSKTSNTCPIDRVKYTSIHKVGHQGDLISQERVTTPPPQDHNADFEPDQATFCEVCSQHDREHEMLLCDRCEAGYHLNCLSPPLREVPEGSWFCPSCTDLGNELAEEVSGLMDDAAVILETRMRRTTAVQPRTARGPRTRGAQRVFDIIHRQATINQPSTSSSVTVRRRQTSRRTRKSKSRRKPRSTHYKVELITVEDGSTLEVKVAVNTRAKGKRYSKKSSKKKCSKGSRKDVNSQRPSNSNLSTRDGPSHSLDLYGNRPQLDYFSSCEAEDELDEDGGGGLALMHRSGVRTNIRSMASRKQIAAQIFNSRPRRPIPKIETSQAPVDLVSSIIEQQEKWLNSNASDYQLTSNGDIKAIMRDTKGTKLRQTAGGYSTSGNSGSSSSATASACETKRDVVGSSGGTSNGGGSSEVANFHPLQPPPEPPSKLYEDDDFDLYADIEPPNSSKLAPPPEPPALLFGLDGDDKEDVGGGSSPEDAGLVIDDRHDTYDPEMPTSPPSPPSPPPRKPTVADNSKQLDLSNCSGPCFSIALEDIPPPPTPPDEGSESECPNQGIYSKMSMEIAKGKDRDSSDEHEDGEGIIIAEKEEKTNSEDEVRLKTGKLLEDENNDGKDEEVELGIEKNRDVEMGDDVSSTNNEDNEKKDDDDDDDDLDCANQSDDGTGPIFTPEKNKTGSDKMSDSDDKDPKGDEESAITNSSDGVDVKLNDKSAMNKSLEKDSEQEGEILELGCEEERDGLVDITDEEMSNYERSWEMEDSTSKVTKSAGLEGLETEAISDCEYPPAETETTEIQQRVEQPIEPNTKGKILENGNKEEEGEILTEEQRVPVQWKKLSKGTKDRSYRGDKDGKNKEKKKEILKKKEKRKELERYDVRKLISEKPRRKVDEFGRDISSNSRSPSRSLSRNRKSPSTRRSASRGKKRRTKSRSRSKERPKEARSVRSRERGRDRSREKSWDRSKEKSAKDRSKERKSPVGRTKKKETRKERAKPARKERGRSRDKNSRERKKRKKSPSMSCSSCSCSSCEREKRRSKKLTVIVPNEEVVEEPSREKTKSKYKKRASSPKRQRRRSPVPSKEVFTSGDNILVSVNFKSSTTNETGRRKEPSMSSKRRKEEESRRKKDKTKENQTVRSIVTAKNPNKRKLNTKNIKPIAIIDLDASPFRETLLSPKEVIILTDSDSEDKITQTENNMPVLVTGPKTPPEPHIKFNIVNNKQQQLRALSNPLLDSSLEQEGDGDEEPNEIIHKGPNTPPEPPVPYDPFEPTKSRSPTPCEIIDAERDPSPTPELNQRLNSPQQLQSSKTPPKVPQHESPKTPSPLRHSPPKVADEATDKPQKQQPFQAAVMDSDDDSGGGGGGGGGGDSPYSPGSSEGDDLFEPPQPLNSNAGVPKPKVRLPLPTVNKYVPLPTKTTSQQPLPKKRSGKSHKENSKKVSGKKEIGIKLDEDQLKILDELPNSAVEMQVKDKFLKKLNRQERVVEEVKLVLKPHYAKKHVTKEEYKDILRKAVPKICHSRSGEINPMKIQRLIEAYVKKYRHKAKKKGSGPAIPPLRQNKSKTLWC